MAEFKIEEFTMHTAEINHSLSAPKEKRGEGRTVSTMRGSVMNNVGIKLKRLIATRLGI